jgi:hypothetical protein
MFIHNICLINICHDKIGQYGIKAHDIQHKTSKNNQAHQTKQKITIKQTIKTKEKKNNNKKHQKQKKLECPLSHCIVINK